MEIFGEERDDQASGTESGNDEEFAANLLASFLQELDETVGDLEQKLVELESTGGSPDLINAIFRAFHNLKGSSTMVGLKTLPELMHYAETVFDGVRQGKLAVTENLISILLDVFGAMRQVKEVVKRDGNEGKARYFAILAKLEALSAEADANAEGSVASVKVEATDAPSEGPAKSGGPDDETLKISRSLVEQLMLVVGDFMLVESAFHFMKSRYSSDWSFLENCQQLAHFSNKMQSTVLRMRLSPIKPIFSSMHRVVRQTAGEVGKKVSLEITGAETLVDRSVLDVIADPLIHMLRNAVDHGLESPDDRLAVGKAAEGSITLAAFHKSGEVVIQISDDGRGIDPRKIREKAVKKGFLTAEAAASLTDGEAQQLIFLPGFSGAEKVTSVSGRGVGMDVVKAVAESLGGNIDLLSNPGSGTTITLRMPLSMAISECLEFRVGDKSYAVPQVCIEEVFSGQSPYVQEKILSVNEGSRVLLLRDTPIPVLDLVEVFGLETPTAEADVHIIQVRYGVTRFALRVGSIVGPCNIVCQPLPQIFSADAPFSGLTRRGDGSLMFQIDLGRLATRLQVQTETKGRSGAKIRGGTQITSSDLRRLQQKIAFFKNYEPFCVPVHAIKQVVSVQVSAIHQVGERTFITLDGVTVPLVWVEETLLGKPRLVRDQYPILIYRIDDRLFGLPMDNFQGIIRMPTHYDNTLRSDAVTGTTVVDDETCMVLDLFGLTARAFGNEIRASSRDVVKIKRLVLAEDDPFFREQLLAFLKGRDLECTAFPDGLALKEWLENPENARSVDAILSDVEMPRMDGLTLTRWVKGTEHTRHLPCLIITALTNKEVIRIAMSAGASAFIPKMHHEQVMQELKRIESGLDKPEHHGLEDAHASQTGRRIVTFELGRDTFAMPMEVLKEVSHVSPNLPVPGYPRWMNSVTAFRGKMVPVIDLHALFEVQATTDKTRQQVIVDFQGVIMALLVDGIGEVLLVNQLTSGEGVGKASRREVHLAQFLRGIFQKDQKLISLVDPAALVKLYQHRGQIAREENAA